MFTLNFLLVLLLQGPTPERPTPGQRIVVGLHDGQQLVVQDPEFTGFIEGRNGEAVLMYHQGNFHGEMPLKTIARIEFRLYRKGKPFLLTVTLRNGQMLDVETERRDFVSLRGKTDFGTISVKQPDPISVPVKLTTRKPDRSRDLTIQFLEIPTS